MASSSSNTPPKRNNNRNRYKGKRNSKNISSYGGPSFLCSICGKNIRDLSSAITEKSTGEPAHFDCIIKNLAKNESVKENEKIVYLGNGKFGIINYENNQNKNFQIIKEIEYEEAKEEQPDWRNRLKKEIL
ncbi:MAG: hypothetical protein B6241_02525 [Spirochaetaceae bacterium 4572_59]|nr:MAG: hypothetical protein B6241_02525 [Spirochaetaceae bacterium 4572_59]